MRNGCFLKCVNYILKNHITKEYLEFINSYKRSKNVTIRCRIPELCERVEIDDDKHNFKSKTKLPRSVIQMNICFYIHKNQCCVVRKKNRINSLHNRVRQIEANFKYAGNKTDEENLSTKSSLYVSLT